MLGLNRPAGVISDTNSISPKACTARSMTRIETHDFIAGFGAQRLQGDCGEWRREVASHATDHRIDLYDNRRVQVVAANG